MLQNLLGLMAVMSFVPSPSPKLDLSMVYGQPLPVQTTVAVGQSQLVEVRKPNILPTPKKKNAKSAGIVTTAKSVFVADVESGGVLYAKNPHNVRSIASLTKLMTSLVLMDTEKKLDGDLTFLPEDFDREGGSEFYIGDTLPRKDVFKAMLVGSVNEAAKALARTSGITMDEFVANMNQKARDLHLDSLSFLEPTGLRSGNKGSAADIAALITIALRVPEVREVLNQPQAEITTQAGKDYKVDTTNLLISSFLNKNPYKIIGAKTGSLPEAGYCMAQVTRNAEGHEVVAVLLGSDNHFSRYSDIKKLTGWAFDSFDWPTTE
jgi:D-alanyl-D-alanine endopeptidase (penicillin-binding protein 7)